MQSSPSALRVSGSLQLRPSHSIISFTTQVVLTTLQGSCVHEGSRSCVTNDELSTSLQTCSINDCVSGLAQS